MAALEGAFRKASSKFKISELNAHQKFAITKILVEKDVFVNLPTGSGKSLIYQALPLVFDHVTDESGHIVIVVSPLISLMEDQVKYLRSLGLSAVNISSNFEVDRAKIEKGEYSIVYGSPEAWLMNERWRCMLSNDIYSRKPCAVAVDEAHVLRHW
ncbi:putative ATP-dependent DNA helicase Q1 [Stylophora pistillata]|uniref:putative ATP-dependent DNA helicase Q1 n=1 Tax=Stylophora pistillata TaxID=50429 RepID=UPI000C03C4D0|nr:putative ATP-dependent DNA helicase Q1 [Stylophora pistillata]